MAVMVVRYESDSGNGGEISRLRTAVGWVGGGGW
jgi:hypothetical protein